MNLEPGVLLRDGCYRIVEMIGQGGFGITYLAEEVGYMKVIGYGVEFVAVKNPDKVVIKELYFKDICSRDPETRLIAVTNTEKRSEFSLLVDKQLEEGKTLKKLNHKNIVRTRDIFRENDTAYMVMDYIHSYNLEQVIAKAGKLTRDKALTYIQEVLSALIYVHQKKILHLDITPSNILIDAETDEAILIDFGASLSYDDQYHIASTTSKLVTGLKKYYAPFEQADLDNLKEFDATFDTYAVGATLYHMLTGSPPPPSSLVVVGRQKIIPPSVQAQSKEISDYLDAVILKALSAQYPQRYATAAELSEALNKEATYTAQINAINKLMGEFRLGDALQEIEKTGHLYFITPLLQELKERCTGELEKGKRDKNFEDQNGLVNTMIAREQYGEALTLLETLQEQFPEKPDLTGRIQACRDKLQVKEATQKKFTDTLAAAQSIFDRGDFEQAITLFTQADALVPGNPDTAEKIRVSKERLQEKNQRLVQYDAAWKKAMPLFNDQNYEEALRYFNEAAKLFPNDKRTRDKIKQCQAVLQDEETQLLKPAAPHEAPKPQAPPPDEVKSILERIQTLAQAFLQFRDQTVLANPKDPKSFWSARMAEIEEVAAPLEKINNTPIAQQKVVKDALTPILDIIEKERRSTRESLEQATAPKTPPPPPPKSPPPPETPPVTPPENQKPIRKYLRVGAIALAVIVVIVVLVIWVNNSKENAEGYGGGIDTVAQKSDTTATPDSSSKMAADTTRMAAADTTVAIQSAPVATGPVSKPKPPPESKPKRESSSETAARELADRKSQYEVFDETVPGIVVVKQDGRYGVVDRNYKTIVRCMYSAPPILAKDGLIEFQNKEGTVDKFNYYE